MKTLTDLRHTLDEHAERVTDDDAVVRATAVRHRVAVVRRRRRAVGAGALALVVGATAGVLGLQRASSDPAPVLLGVRAPETMTSLSYTYGVDGWSDTVDGHATVKIPASSRERLISWTLQGTPSVRFVLPNGEIWHSQESRFRDFVALPAGQTGTLQVSAGQGRVGLATYAITAQAPPGYTKDGITFRRTVATTPLLGAVINDLGQTDVSTTYVVPRGQADVHLLCTGLPSADAVHVSVNGHERLGGDCPDQPTFDPAVSGGYQFHLSHPGRTVVLRVWVSEGVKLPKPLPAGSVPHLRMGVGVYGPAETKSIGAGLRVDAFVEQDGHLWMEATGTVAGQGQDVRELGRGVGALPFQGPAAATWDTTGHTRVSFHAGGMPTAGGAFPAGQGGIGDLWVPRGATVHLTLDRGRGPIGFAVYRRAD